MYKLYNNKSKTGYVLPNQLQGLWRYVMVLAAVLSFAGTNVFAQSPCNAHRWNAGDGWRYNTTTSKWEAETLNSPSLQPKGIVRCASSAETETSLQDYAAKYDPTKFAINTSLTNCFSQVTGTRPTSPPLTVTGPTTNKDIIWFNFDIRPLAGTYQFQIVTNDQVGWALYYVDPEFAGPIEAGTSYPTGLSGFGTCESELSRLLYADCGISGNGWSTIKVPSFTKPSNYYLAMWPLNQDSFTNNLIYKSRYGCGGSTCTLEKFGDPTLACTANGYTVCQTFYGSAGKWKVTDNAALGNEASSYSITTYDQNNVVVENYTATTDDNLFLELGTITGTGVQSDVRAVICATYASGKSFDISLSPSGVPAGAPNDYVDCTSNARFNGNGLTTPSVNPGAYGPLCLDAPPVTLNGTPAGGTWSGTGVSFDGNVYKFTPATAGMGTHTLTYSIPENSTTCASQNTTSILVKQTPTVTAGPNQTVCAASPIQTLTATATVSNGATLKWFTLASGGIEVASPTLNSIGTVTYYAQASLNGCSSGRVPVVLTINESPTVTAGNPQTVCATSPIQTLTATATVSEGATLKWFTLASGGMEVASPTLNTIGTVTYYAQAFLGSCFSARVPVVLTIKQTPTVTAGPNQTVCATSPIQTLTATATVSNGATLKWFTLASGGIEVASPTLNSIGTVTYYAQASLNGCLSGRVPVVLTINESPTVTAGPNQTVCEGQSVQLAGVLGGSATSGNWISLGTGTFDDATKLNAVYTPSVADIMAGSVTLKLTSNDPAGPCVPVNKTLLVTINKCSKIALEKLTNGAVDPTKTWSFTISGGDLTNPVTQTVMGDADGILFGNLTLSKYKTYTICETNVAAGFLIRLEYQDAAGTWVPVTAYDPNVINGGGDFSQGEAVGNYCFTIGANTGIPLQGNIYGDNNISVLRIRINNISPPGGTARTPGYWKNWNTCTSGNQAQTAAKNGGPAAGVYLLDNHLPHTLWSTGSATATCNLTSFVLTSCQQAVLILDERQNGGKGAKMASDAAYKLAKHLLAYQLNIKSGSAPCAVAATAATNAMAMLAKYCFDGTKSSYLSNKGATSTDYTLALQYAKTLDAYNNNLPCPAGPVLLSKKSPAGGELLAPNSDSKLNAYPNPYTHKATIEFTLPEASEYTLVLYDVKGSVVKTIGNGKAEAGKVYSFEIGNNNMPEGIYLVRLSTGKFNKVVRISLRR